MVPQCRRCCTCPRRPSTSCCRALQCKADHVDDDVGLQVGDLRAKGAGRVSRLAVDDHSLDGRPGAVGLIGLALAPADVDDFEAGANQPRDQVCPHMAAPADNYNTGHGNRSFAK